jgi:molybdate transport system ATP-binding protein
VTTPMLAVNIQKQLGAFALDVAFDAAVGITVLFGPSGAGKSATLALIAGALSPDAGRIALGGTPLFDKTARIDLKPEQRGVGWVFQGARLFPHLSVEGNLRYGLKRASSHPVRIPFDAVVQMLGVGALLDRRPLTLSGGEAQRVAIGRALLSQPSLLLMDEPLSSLDDFRKEEILAFIEQVRDAFALPILYVTHSQAEALRLAERIVVLDVGRVVCAGPPQDAMATAIARFTASARGAISR